MEIRFFYFWLCSASEIGNKGCMFIFHQPEIPEELKNM